MDRDLTIRITADDRDFQRMMAKEIAWVFRISPWMLGLNDWSPGYARIVESTAVVLPLEGEEDDRLDKETARTEEQSDRAVLRIHPV